MCQSLGWRDALRLITNVRDGRLSLGPFVGFEDEVLTLGFLLASDNYLPYGQDTMALHRQDGAETLFLLGAARSPGAFMQELRRFNVFSWPRHNYDYQMILWTLANPSLTGNTRSHAIVQNAPQVIARLRAEGHLTLRETIAWIQTGSPEEVRGRTLAVLNLPEGVPGSRDLKRTALRLCPDLAAVAAELSAETRTVMSSTLSDDPSLREIVEGLLEEWRSDAGELIAAARTLRAGQS
jgi:hypothetical protein